MNDSGTQTTPAPRGYVVVIPGSPALIPQLAPANEPSRQLLVAARQVIQRALAVAGSAGLDLRIVGSRAARWHTAHTGSFRAWGDGPGQVGMPRLKSGNYLPELIARFVAEDREPRWVDEHLGVTAAGGELTIVVAEGSAGLDDKAPLALLPDAAAADASLRALLGGDAASWSQHWNADALAHAGVVEPYLWPELAAWLAAQEAAGHAVHRELVAADTSLGVGRYVALWEWTPKDRTPREAAS